MNVFPHDAIGDGPSLGISGPELHRILDLTINMKFMSLFTCPSHLLMMESHIKAHLVSGLETCNIIFSGQQKH
jgi:hypothetical protein